MADINVLGDGLEYSEHEDCYIIRVMKKGDFGKSKSGKSMLVGTTRGAVAVNELMFNINIYKPITPKAKAETKPAKKMLIM